MYDGINPRSNKDFDDVDTKRLVHPTLLDDVDIESLLDSLLYPETILDSEGFGDSRLCSYIQHEQHHPPPTRVIEWNYLIPLPPQDLECAIKTAKIKDISSLHKARNVVFLDFYDILANPPEAFKNWIRRLGYEELSYNAVIDESHPITAFVCRRHNRSYYLPNYEILNPLLKKHKSTLNSTSRFVNNLLKLCEQIKADYVIFMTLTAPKEFDEEKLKKAFKKFVKKLEKELFNSAKLGIAYNIHIWGTKTLQPHPHIHVILPNVVEKDGKFHRIRPWLDETRLKEIWKECLEIDQKPDLHIKYVKSDNRGRIAHWVKYSSRKPIIDIVSYFIKHGKAPEISDEWAKVLIEYVNRRVCIGFLRNMKKIIGENREKKRYCPICGSESEKVEAIPRHEFETMFKDGNLIVVFYDPKIRWYRLMYNALDEIGLSAALVYCDSDD